MKGHFPKLLIFFIFFHCFATIAPAKEKPKLDSEIEYLLKIYKYPQEESLYNIISFLRDRWVPRDLLNHEIELSITSSRPAAEIIAWYKFSPPNSLRGKLYYYDALAKTKKTFFKNDAIKKEFLDAWRQTLLSNKEENYFYKTYQAYITPKLLHRKIERAIWQGNYVTAETLMKFLPLKLKRHATVHLQLARSPKALHAILKASPNAWKQDSFIRYLYVKSLLKANNDEQAMRVLLAHESRLMFPMWWKLKHIAIRNAIREKKFVNAFKLTQNHNLTPGTLEYAEAEWLAGWISLRFLNQANTALSHFKNLFNHTKFGTSKSQAAYWIGRTYAQMNNLEKQNEWYKTASNYQGYFYGQLAALEMEKEIRPFQQKTTVQKHKFSKNYLWAYKLAKVANTLYKQQQAALADKIIAHIAKIHLTHEEYNKIADCLHDNVLAHVVVKFTKQTANWGNPLLKHGYPLHRQLDHKHKRAPLYLAIIRQESEFNQNALSSAGAYGLMQLMPETARMLAKKLGLKPNAFKQSPKANIMKGQAYVDQLLAMFDSAILTIAAYNAGPEPVLRWVKNFGNPKNLTDNYQVIDWIESLPYGETRFYVKKVLENYFIYSHLLQKDKNFHPLRH
jgi:soluble lytic murein transglycosylase